MNEPSKGIEKAAAEGFDTFGVKGVRSTPVGLTFEANDLPFDDWQNIGRALGAMRDWSSWAMGDWISFGEEVYGEMHAQAIEATGRAKSTLLEYLRVARKVAPERRRSALPWTVHQCVASRRPQEQVEWLDRVEAHGWSVEELRGALRDTPPAADGRGRSRARVEVLALVDDVAGAVLRAATPLGDGYARVPMDVLVRLANARDEVWP
jgi:hypothetical protein